MGITTKAFAGPLAFFLAASGVQAQPPASPAPDVPISWEALQALPLPIQDVVFPYGKSPSQIGELRVPAGSDGPYPVVVLIHGGCWQSAHDYVYMTRVADWFERRGIATWTLEYRRLGEPGGGWPGTFADIADGTDKLRMVAKTHSLDLKRVYAAGHAAGGQLALWLASREELAEKSELFRKNALQIRGVVGLAAITDLAAYRQGPAGSCNASVDALMGGDPERFPRRYAETSPRQRLPLDVPVAFVHGGRDPVASPVSVHDFVEAATKAGDRAKLITLPEAGHYDVVAPGPNSEAALAEAWGFVFDGAR